MMPRSKGIRSSSLRIAGVMAISVIAINAFPKSLKTDTQPSHCATIRETGYKFPADLDRESAAEVLSYLPLRGPEGLWEFEPDEVTLMILADKQYPGQYGIYVVDAVDCRLQPGLRIGYLEESLDRNSFHLRLMSHWKKNSVDLPVKGAATLNDKDGILKIEGGSLKFSISPSIVLPNLLSLLRLRVGIKLNNPEQNLPTGLRRVYPTVSGLTEIPAWL